MIHPSLNVPDHVLRALDRCEPWRGYVDPQGYGRLRRKGRTLYAHRFVYERFYGPLDPGQRVYRTCENRSCVNPLHLSTERPESRAPQRPASAKLTPRKVRNIRKVWSQPGRPTQAELAGRYGVSRSCISLVVRDVSWSDV